jgi:hypothetical protein
MEHFQDGFQPGAGGFCLQRLIKFFGIGHIQSLLALPLRDLPFYPRAFTVKLPCSENLWIFLAGKNYKQR